MDPRPPTETPVLGRRERNKQRVRERLYAAAIELFVDKGYDHTSIDEIAERADVARGTFFNYFQRKEDLISAWTERRRWDLVTVLAEAQNQGDSPIEQLTRCMAALGQLNQDEHELTVAMLTAWVKAGRPILEEPYVADIFAQIVKAGIAQGELSADLVPQHVGNVLRDVYLGALYRWVSEPEVSHTGALTEELLSILHMLFGGLAAPAGQQPTGSQPTNSQPVKTHPAKTPPVRRAEPQSVGSA
ncbi:TetR/AcrR family transcriptional regulator [Kitasatospora kifunensis]|uniref:AcrR family transcriptional regulator n=1 Tax=Kitasatospora kifunensis TaxID=58351 RepID=A0A7W7R4K8_KITKI|nr:TetR/AcrR family transcriptional regulator [Kitasatospora kifunensis]MBB4924746.1 AcrR family transcriptional regulator [Kitasatospora kifunensis]